MGRSTIIGTVEEAIAIEESKLGLELPSSFKEWLIENNSQNIGDIHIYPVRDERDTRKTWYSLSMLYDEVRLDRITQSPDKPQLELLPFAELEDEVYFCFDYKCVAPNGEQPIVIWALQTREINSFAKDFRDFLTKVNSDEAAGH